MTSANQDQWVKATEAPRDSLIGKTVRFDPSIIGKDTNFSGTDKVDLHGNFTVVADNTATKPNYPTHTTKSGMTMITSFESKGTITTRMITVKDGAGNQINSNASRFQVLEQAL